jgi:hypothetical protein
VLKYLTTKRVENFPTCLELTKANAYRSCESNRREIRGIQRSIPIEVQVTHRLLQPLYLSTPHFVSNTSESTKDSLQESHDTFAHLPESTLDRSTPSIPLLVTRTKSRLHSTLHAFYTKDILMYQILVGTRRT